MRDNERISGNNSSKDAVPDGKKLSDHEIMSEPVSGSDYTLSYPQIYQQGKTIEDKYIIRDLIGKGGFSEVYLALDQESGTRCALRVLRDKHFSDISKRKAFSSEIAIWLTLESHPYILMLQKVFIYQGRFLMILDYIEPDESGFVTLGDHIQGYRKSLDEEKILEWSIQFCHGMEYLPIKGIKCHRDIKPDNILITRSKVLKITDFGLVVGMENANDSDSLISCDSEELPKFSLFRSGEKMICGTLGYIPPEVLQWGNPDIRSDIHSFGSVLWQMTSGSKEPPFYVPFSGDINEYIKTSCRLQNSRAIPRIDSFLRPVIERCLDPDPGNRYKDFCSLRHDLEDLLDKRFQSTVDNPGTKRAGLERLNAISTSLFNVHEYQKALEYADKALSIDPNSVSALDNKGRALMITDQVERAIECFDLALRNDPASAPVLGHKALAYSKLKNWEQAVDCCNKALTIDPDHGWSLNEKARALWMLGQLEEANTCLKRIFEIHPEQAFLVKGNMARIYLQMGEYEEAIQCCDIALEYDPLSANTFISKGEAYHFLEKYQEAINCFLKALEIDTTAAHVSYAYIWYIKGRSEEALGRLDDAENSYRKVLELAKPHGADLGLIEDVKKKLKKWIP